MPRIHAYDAYGYRARVSPGIKANQRGHIHTKELPIAINRWHTKKRKKNKQNFHHLGGAISDRAK